jgi:hypothetical protein
MADKMCSWCGKPTIEGKCVTFGSEKVHGGDCEKQFCNSRGLPAPKGIAPKPVKKA